MTTRSELEASTIEEMDDYVCPSHELTGGYEPCCACGGWRRSDPNRGRMCTEAVEESEN